MGEPESAESSTSAACEADGRAAVPASSVLYVEDDEVNTVLMQCIFETLPGWTLRTARSAAEGLREALAQAPDLLLLDMHLPDMTGLELLQVLATHTTTAAIPCILVTADATEAIRSRALEQGCLMVLHKPLSLLALSVALEQAGPRR
jgi:CheY-like chemotaxis protein